MDSFGVATFNVCGLPWRRSGLPPLAERAEAFGPVFEASGLDVINMQEVASRGALQAIRSRLPSFPYVAWRPGLAGQPAGGLATFSRQPVREVVYRSFRGLAPRAGSRGFRVKQALNSTLQGVLTVALPGVVVANTHLTANKDGNWSATNRYHDFQRAQLTRVHQILSGLASDLVIVTGDFNITSSSVLYPQIVGAFRDPFAGGDPPTFRDEFLPPGMHGKRIDYALVSGLESRFPIRSSEVLFQGPIGELFPSDHRGLAVRVGQ